MNMKIKLGALFALSTSAVIAFVAGTSNLVQIRASEANRWSHYSASERGLEKNGSKEYWVSCESHEHQFTKPDVADSLIDEKGVPSESEINSWAENDDRLLEAFKRYYDFNDNNLHGLFETVQNVSGIDASDGKVQVHITGNDYGATLIQEYLDAAFADENVTSIAFDALSEEVTNNFRHRTTGSNVTYEGGAEGSGLASTYKTFYFTRSMYNATKNAGDALFYGGGSTANKILFIDNLRVQSRERDNQYYFDFDNGYFTDSNYRLGSGTAVAAATSNLEIGLTNEVTAGGARSVYLKKPSGEVAVYVNSNSNFFKNMPENGMLFDVRSTAAFNHTVGMRDGNRADLLTSDHGLSSILNANQWYTYHVSKSNMTSDGRFLIFAGSTTATIYVDNFRYADTDYCSFEDENVGYNGEYVTVSNQEFENTNAGHSTLRDNALYYDFVINTAQVSNAQLDTKHVSNGAKSLRVDFKSNGYGMYSLNPWMVEYLSEGKTIKMDVYSEGVTFASSSLLKDVKVGQWTTVSISKDSLIASAASTSQRLSNKCYRFQANNTATGSVWFDNIRVA